MVNENCDREIIVQITQSFDEIDIDVAKLEKLVKEICGRFDLSEATVSIAILDDAGVIEVNKKFLNSSADTDVISFDLSNEDAESGRLFELVVNGQKAVEQAALRGHSALAEAALYITHGLLHNLGFDDSSAEKAKKMHDTEDEILQQMGFGVVYKE